MVSRYFVLVKKYERVDSVFSSFSVVASRYRHVFSPAETALYQKHKHSHSSKLACRKEMTVRKDKV